MADKNKSSREVRKPKQEQNKKQKGQTPPAGPTALDAMNRTAGRPKA